MKIVISILIFTTFIFANEINYHKNGNIKSEIIYDDSNKTKIKKIYRKNGHILLIQMFKNNKQNGIETWYYNNGQIWIESEYKDSNQHGFSKEYTNQKFLFKESLYKKGILISVKKYYKNTNIIEAIATYKQNKLNGLSISYYKNTNKRSVIPYIKGKVNGTVKLYHKTGQLYSNLIFENDILKSIEKYSKTGTLVLKSNIKNKKYDGTLYEFYDNGKKKNTFHFKDGKVITHRLKRWLDGCEQSQRLPLSSISS